MAEHPLKHPALVLAVLACLAAGGCPPSPVRHVQGAAQVRKAVLSGFENPPSRLFISRGRLSLILEHLGYHPNRYSCGCDRSSDGISVRQWNSGRTEAVVITKGQPARVITTPPGAFLDDRNATIAWRTNDASDHKITFAGGKEVFAPGFRPDSSGRFFCYGGRYYDYEARVGCAMPIRLASVDAPDKILATSRLQGLLAALYVTDAAVFIVVRSDGGAWPNDLTCEEYACQDGGVVRKRQFTLRSPSRFVGVGVNFVPEDFDPVSRAFLVKVSRDMPLGSNIWYVYDLRTGRFRRVGVFEGYAGFLDRGIFDRALEGPSTRPSVSDKAKATRREGGLAGGATTAPDGQQSVPWSLMVTVSEDAGKQTTTFLATAVNATDKEQVLFTPGLVGPILYPVGDRGQPLETFVPPRRGQARQHDFVRLRPGQGFTRTFVHRGPLRGLTSVSRVGAKLFIYEPGKEGHSRHVARVIKASPIDINVKGQREGGLP